MESYFNKAIEHAKALQQIALEAAQKGLEQSKPLVQEGVARATELQKSLIEQTPHLTAAAQQQANAALQHASAFIATGKAVLEAGAGQAQQHQAIFAEQAKKQGMNVDAMFTNDIIGSSTGASGERDNRTVRVFSEGVQSNETPEEATLETRVEGPIEVAIDRALCVGSGPCFILAPGTFALDDAMKAIAAQPKSGNAPGEPFSS